MILILFLLLISSPILTMHHKTDTANAIVATLRDLQNGVAPTPSVIVRFHTDGQVIDDATPQQTVQLQALPPQRIVNRWIYIPRPPEICRENRKAVCSLFAILAGAIAVVIWRLT